MKWLRRIVMLLLVVAIGVTGVLACMNIKPWKDAQKEYDAIEAETFDASSIESDKYKTKLSTTENQKSVAFVYSLAPDGSGYAWGTCYAIGEYGEGVQYFVTNGHVVEFYLNNNFDLNIIFDDDIAIAPEVVFYENDVNLDMAILKLPEPVDYREAVLIRDSSTVVVNEKCTAIGYPDKAAKLDADFRGAIKNQNVNSGVISKLDLSLQGVKYKVFQHDAWITHGNSGGPLFDENGFFIGMNTSGNENSENVNFAIVSNEITSVLDSEGISYTTSKAYLKDIEKKANKQTKKLEDDFDEEHEEALDDAMTKVNEKRNKVLIFGAIAVACIVALLIVFILGNKKVVVMGEQDDGKKSYLVCVAGIFAGQSFEITGHTMTIGRDQHTCTFVFPEDTPGISSNHCSVYFDSRTKSFVLTDNGSTYGTYLSDGRKLTKGVPETIIPGSTFSLADKTNVFKVDRM